MSVLLVRHGRPLADATTPAASWELDPAGFDDVWALRARLPQGAAWFSAPEPAAVETCQLLTEGEVGILAGLRAQEPAETAAAVEERVVALVGRLVEENPGRDLVLVGHLESWIALAGDAAAGLGTPDVLELSEPLLSAG